MTVYTPQQLAAIRNDLDYHSLLHHEVRKALQDAMQPWPCIKLYDIQVMYGWQEAVKAIQHYDGKICHEYVSRDGYKSTVGELGVSPQKNNYRIRKRKLK